MDSEATFFQMTGITKSYWMGDEWSPVLRGIDLTIQEGEFLSVLGPSGSGKSTLMNIIGCLDTPTSGLDQKTGHQVMDLFHELHDEGRTIIMITHDRHIAQNASRLVRILDGVLSEGAEDDA